MTIRDDLLAERADIDRKLNIINRVGEDTFPIGTIVVFSSPNHKWYYLKMGEEAWRPLFSSNRGESKQLVIWILEAEDSNIGYFEVYKLTVDATPFYASA